MSASKVLRMIMIDKDIKQIDIAEKLGIDKQTLYNKLSRDSMNYKTVSEIASLLGCEIVFRDKETGKIYY